MIIIKRRAAAKGDRWVRASRSTPNNNCVELWLGRTAVGVRDSKNLTGGILTFDRRQWNEFLVRAVR
ncbi:DUF397 domain-containing protein [Actinophytocola algeriensis]|nr:DUF397 domain-containing protein [Actinophytocola algeriensis]